MAPQTHANQNRGSATARKVFCGIVGKLSSPASDGLGREVGAHANNVSLLEAVEAAEAG